MQPDTWHYSRPALAADYLAIFARGLTSARGLFARRRMGKTEFLEQDLIPAARAAGYLTAYVNLWDNRAEPGQALAAALYVAAEPKGWDKFLSRLKQPVKKLKAGGKLPGGVEGSIEAELDAASRPPVATLLTETMRKLDTRRARMLLLIDEAQVLAQPDNSDFAHALRAALDIRKDYIKVIFAGSSESTLRTMFGRSSEPFYNWAALEPFELLDRAFVEAMVVKANDLSKYPIDLADALAAFSALHSTPEYFRRFLDRFLSHADSGAAAALAYTREHVFSGAVAANQWQELLPADQSILAFIASDEQHDLYGQAVRERLAMALGLEEVSKSTVQNAIARLARRNIITAMGQGRYQFEDQAFATWIRERDAGQ